MAAKVEPTAQSAGSDDELNQQLHAIIEDLQRAGLQPNYPEEDEPVERNELDPGIAPHLDHEALERNTIYGRLAAIENQKRKGEVREGSPAT